MNDERIIICETCKGRGTHDVRRIDDYHKREFECITNVCNRCKGSGRLLVTTTINPYKNPYFTFIEDLKSK